MHALCQASLSVCRSVCLSLSACLYVCMQCIYVRLRVCVCDSMFVCVYLCASVYFCVCECVCVSVYYTMVNFGLKVILRKAIIGVLHGSFIN